MKAMSAVLCALFFASFAQAQQTWTRTYGGGGTDYGNSVRQTSDGGYVIAGFTTSFGAGYYDAYLIGTNASGDTIWTRTYGGAGDDRANSVQQTLDGGYIVAGRTYSFADTLHGDVYLIKTNASGDTIWTRTYGGADNDEGFSVRQTLDSGYIVAGLTFSHGAGSMDIYLIKTNASGDTVWTRTYGGTDEDHGHSVQQSTDGGYIIAGYTASFGAGNDDVFLIKTNASGDTLWTRTYGGTGYDYGFAVQQTSDGGYVVAGSTDSYGADGYDVYLVKTDANGGAGIDASAGGRPGLAGSMRTSPNPFASLARVPGHETERFDVYDISGMKVGTFRGDRIGEGLSPAVYFVRLDDGHGGSMRVVKAR